MEKKDCLSINLAKTLMKRYPHPDNYPYMSWCYPQGFMLTGFIRLYEDTGDPVYREYVLKFAQHHVGPDGDLFRFKGRSMDDMMAGCIICWAYHETGLEKYRIASDFILSKFEDYPRASHGGFLHSSRGTPGQMWVDGVFMGGMFMLAYAKYVGKSESCWGELIRQLDCIYGCCHKAGGLLYHAWSEDPTTVWRTPENGCSTDVWSEGLGWYALILTEIVRQLPRDHTDLPRLTARLTEMLDTLSTLQDAEGLWYQVVDKPDGKDNWTDTSGSAMFTYAFSETAKVVPEKADAYLAVAKKGMEGLYGRAVINDRGLIDIIHACDGLCVQKCYEDYVYYPQKVNAKEAVAAVLWAAETMERECLKK